MGKKRGKFFTKLYENKGYIIFLVLQLILLYLFGFSYYTRIRPDVFVQETIVVEDKDYYSTRRGSTKVCLLYYEGRQYRYYKSSLYTAWEFYEEIEIGDTLEVTYTRYPNPLGIYQRRLVDVRHGDVVYRDLQDHLDRKGDDLPDVIIGFAILEGLLLLFFVAYLLFVRNLIGTIRRSMRRRRKRLKKKQQAQNNNQSVS